MVYSQQLFYLGKTLLREVSILGVFLVRIFPHSDWIRSDSPYLSVFIPNAGKNETKKRLKRKSSIKS